MDPPIDPEKSLPSKSDDTKSFREGNVGLVHKGRLAWARKLLFDTAEARGVDPVPLEERTDKTAFSLFTLWFTANCTLLPITTGMSGTLVFGLSLGAASIISSLSTLVFMLPVAWMGVMGPKTGLRQMVQTRYYFGFFLVLVIVLFQLATLTGYTMITSIVSGQTLAALSNGSLSLTVGIVISVIAALPISFMGYRFLHYFEQYSWIPTVVAVTIAVGVGAKNLHHQVETITPSVRTVLTFTSICASLSLSWAALVSDFCVYISPDVPRYKIFLSIYAGYCIPSIILLCLGAAIGGAVPNVPSWVDANDAYSVGGVMYAMVSPTGGFGKFVAVLLAFSVVGLTACSLYSLSISLQSLHPQLARVPRYLFAIIIAAIVIGVSVAAASNFYGSLSNFLGIVGYWTAAYVGIALTEHHYFRQGNYRSYNPEDWNLRERLPMGLAAIAAFALSFALIVPSMDATWYTGYFGKRIGDVGIEVGLIISSILYLVFRSLEVRYLCK